MDQHSSGRAGVAVLSLPEEQFFDTFLGAAAAVRRKINADLLEEYNITLSDFQALRLLAEAPGRRMRLLDLADARLLSRSRIRACGETTAAGGRWSVRRPPSRAQAQSSKRGSGITLCGSIDAAMDAICSGVQGAGILPDGSGSSPWSRKNCSGPAGV
jgi:hypothetical protein